MLTSRYIAGEGAAVIRPTGTALVSSGISDDAASALWQATAQIISGDAIVAILQHFGQSDLPFASVEAVGTKLRAIAGGGARVELQAGDGTILTVGGGAAIEREDVDGALRATLLLPDNEARLGEGWHVESGLVGSSQVTSIFEPEVSDSLGPVLDDEVEATVIAPSVRGGESVADAELIRELVSAVDLTGIAADFAEGVDTDTSEVDEASAIASPLSVVLATGLVVPLDRPLIMGRAPIYSRAVGAETPRLLAFDSPARDISRTHVQISQIAEKAVVTDLHSTNGVYITIPGRDSVRLAPNVPTTVQVGTVIDIGEGATFVIRESA
ncbi:hypothetical protein GCM10010401_04840 [Rarobacter faecitabidus]|uniref:FHA domain-containing protein n=1 Tax=Rarobacter faecitabidus TaxID=13243 RepID=A0A542ZU85_RARFA|nr:FHA domain-containing protein [Rarobacter faecitabidus]TQL63760.1 FHA domain-containing protein [Rarobacter faecitabidus]